MESKKKLQEKKLKKQVSFLQYSGMSLQMGVTIGLFVFIGIKLDAWMETNVIFTLICALFGVGAALYFFIKQVITENED